MANREIRKKTAPNHPVFFMVLGEGPPVKRHKTHQEALGVAHAMARLHRGQEFVVMRAASAGVVYKTDVKPQEDSK